MTKSRPLCTQEKLVRLYGISNPTHLWKFSFAKIANLTTLFTDTHREKAQIKLQESQKIRIWTFA